MKKSKEILTDLLAYVEKKIVKLFGKPLTELPKSAGLRPWINIQGQVLTGLYDWTNAHYLEEGKDTNARPTLHTAQLSSSVTFSFFEKNISPSFFAHLTLLGSPSDPSQTPSPTLLIHRPN